MIQSGKRNLITDSQLCNGTRHSFPAGQCSNRCRFNDWKWELCVGSNFSLVSPTKSSRQSKYNGTWDRRLRKRVSWSWTGPGSPQIYDIEHLRSRLIKITSRPRSRVTLFFPPSQCFSSSAGACCDLGAKHLYMILSHPSSSLLCPSALLTLLNDFCGSRASYHNRILAIEISSA